MAINCICGKVIASLDDKFCPQCGKPCNRMMKERGEVLAELIAINGLRDRTLNSNGNKDRQKILEEVTILLLTSCMEHCYDWVLGNTDSKPSEKMMEMVEKKFKIIEGGQ